MKTLIVLALTTLLAHSMRAQSETIQFKTKTYDEAKNAKSFFKFIGASTKIGLVTTSFDGFAKKAELSYEEKETEFEKIRLVIDADELDTDVSKRDKKLRKESLETDKFKVITIEVPKISKTAERQEVEGKMNVRGQDVPLKITIKKQNDKTYTGESSFKLSDAKIPDPSIAVAKVKDEFEIKFKISL